MIILGLDLSLTATGVCILAWMPDGLEKQTFTIKSKGKKGAPVADTVARIDGIGNQFVGRALRPFGYYCDLAVIEAPSYGSKNGSQHERGGLWWHVAYDLWSNSVPIATVSPQGRAKYATGKGNAGKDEVLAAVIKRYSDIDITDNNVADAVVLAAMGARHIGTPIDDVPKANLAAMDGASWPS